MMLMREPALWWRENSAAAAMLAPLGGLYGAVAGRRMRMPGESVGVPVVCVGNFTVGGAGKTPTAMTLARMLRDAGDEPFFLTRGYGGRERGPLRVDPERHRAADVGDEPLMLARVAPTIVAQDRVAGARAARDGGASVIVMDDGFQNPSLQKTMSLVVVDGLRGIGNGRVIPAGPLRAPLETQLACAHGVLVIGPGESAPSLCRMVIARGIALFRGRLVADADTAAALAGRKVLAFAGIANPDKFYATLAQAGIDVRVRQSYGDHHRYTRAEAAALIAQARRDGLLLVTTEKDLARLAGDEAGAELARATRALPVRLTIDNEPAFRTWLLSSLGRRG
jgi:tetraacyldisaccharide 4'-kinase